MPVQISLPIVGVDYPNKRGPTRRFALQMCQPGDRVDLRCEPNNPADPHAIAVFSAQGVQIGYLPAERAPYVGLRMRRGDVSAIFQQLTLQGGAVRIAFDGEIPTLPPQSDKTQDRDWWPDEEWPET